MERDFGHGQTPIPEGYTPYQGKEAIESSLRDLTATDEFQHYARCATRAAQPKRDESYIPRWVDTTLRKPPRSDEESPSFHPDIQI